MVAFIRYGEYLVPGEANGSCVMPNDLFTFCCALTATVQPSPHLRRNAAIIRVYVQDP
jgi:hypothetical protein